MVQETVTLIYSESMLEMKGFCFLDVYIPYKQHFKNTALFYLLYYNSGNKRWRVWISENVNGFFFFFLLYIFADIKHVNIIKLQKTKKENVLFLKWNLEVQNFNC